MTSTFQTAQSTLLAQPPQASQFYVRSSNDSDTTSLNIVGNISGTPTAQSLTLVGKQEVLSSDTFQSIISAVLTATQAGVVSIYSAGTAGQGRIVVLQPADGDTFFGGLIGHVTTYTFKTALTGAANEVLIGADANATSINLREAIRAGDAVIGDGTGAGTNYGTGTVANAYFTVNAISGSVLSTVDRCPCLRQLAWSFGQTGTSVLSVQAPIAALDGTLLVQLAIGSTAAYGVIILDDEALTLLTLPPATLWTSDWIVVEGAPGSLYLSSSNVTTGMATKYQTSTDPNLSVIRDGTTTITALDNNIQVINPVEFIRYLRLVIHNTNSAPASVNAKLVY